MPRSLAFYGGYTPPERRYTVTFQYPGYPWIFTMSPVDADTYQGTFDEMLQRGYRPVALAVTADHLYMAVFATGPAVGNWIGRHNLTADQYQQAFTDVNAQGLIPLTV